MRTLTFKLCLLLTIMIHHGNASAQNACLPANASEQIVCANNKFFAGAQTDIGATYTWFKSGEIKEGPLTGNGGPVSFGYDIVAFGDAGQYSIERKVGNGTPTCVFNTRVTLIQLPVEQEFTGGGYLCAGQRTLTIGSSEIDVSYQLVRNGTINVGSPKSGTGSAINFSVGFPEAIYSIRAQNDNCTSSSAVTFGQQEIAITPQMIVNYNTTTTANVTFPGTGNYVLEVGAGAGFNPGTGASAGVSGTIIPTPSQTLTLTGLTPGSTYAMYTRQLCGTNTYTSNSFASSFTTDCATVSTFPYTEGFESAVGSTLPACVRGIDNNDDNIITALAYGVNLRTGIKCAGILGADRMLLPRMNLGLNKRLKFFVKTTGAALPYKVKVSTTNNGKTAFTDIYTDTVTVGDYLEKTVNLSAYTGLTYLAFESVAGKTLFIDDIKIETIPSCAGPTFVRSPSTTNNQVVLNWQGAGSYILEYGATGFTPGTGASAGAGGTIVNNAASPYTVTGLNANTKYDFYIRQKCSSVSFSLNSPKLTINTFINCAPATVLAACTNTTASFPGGNGTLDFEGVYPLNSAGFKTPGTELLYKFTPASTGVYYIDLLTNSTGATVDYLYKPVSVGCSNVGWIGIKNISAVGKVPVGLLTAGTDFYILGDKENVFAVSHTFKICKATTAPPPDFNRCIGTIAMSNTIPAKSPKEEYVIDSAGNLIAGINFSNLGDTVNGLKVFYNVHSGTVLRDDKNKEYLDRNINVSSNNDITGPIGIKLFFANAELQRLVNEPNDGLADVSTVGDLNVTKSIQSCADSALNLATTFLPQSSNGNYDAASGFVNFSSLTLGSFYLHGGTAALYQSKDSLVICPYSTTSFTTKNIDAGYTYKWQIDNGSGFQNISDNETYSGANTTTLTIADASTELYGTKFRSVSTNGSTVVNGTPQVLKFSITWNGNFDNNFSDPRNYNCVRGPDENTDVIIPAVSIRNPIVKANSRCRSIRLGSGAILSVKQAFQLFISGE